MYLVSSIQYFCWVAFLENVDKEADKGGGWGILPFKAYNDAILTKLEEKCLDAEGREQPKYPRSSPQQLKREYAIVKSLVDEGRRKGFVGEKDAENAMPPKPTPARLYGNPKTHKAIQPGSEIPPLREIVSNSGSNCEGLGKIIDAITRPVDERASTFIMDTPDLLRKIEQLNEAGPQPIGTHLFSCDVDWARLEIERRFLHEHNLVDDGLNINM